MPDDTPGSGRRATHPSDCLDRRHWSLAPLLGQWSETAVRTREPDDGRVCAEDGDDQWPDARECGLRINEETSWRGAARP